MLHVRALLYEFISNYINGLLVFGITTLNITTVSIMTFSIGTLSTLIMKITTLDVTI